MTVGRRSRPPPALALVALVATLAAGCGLGPGEEREGDGASLRVTRDFGARLVSSDAVERVREDQTVMRLLRSQSEIETRYGGGFVQSIDGLEGGGEGGFIDWFYFVNGIEADRGAADYELSPGDVVQWDRRDWRATPDVRAIVGAYPEPFLHGLEGRRLPVRVECEDAESDPCRAVKAELVAAGVPASGAALGASGTQDVARVVVATWSRARELPTARVLEGGPSDSGVFVRFRDAGRRVELLDARGDVERVEGPDTGIVAALRPTDSELLWLVTGGSEAGVANAVKAFERESLRDAFAVAARPQGEAVALPLADGEER